jgi:hypothetical protein
MAEVEEEQPQGFDTHIPEVAEDRRTPVPDRHKRARVVDRHKRARVVDRRKRVVDSSTGKDAKWQRRRERRQRRLLPVPTSCCNNIHAPAHAGMSLRNI